MVTGTLLSDVAHQKHDSDISFAWQESMGSQMAV